MRRAKGMKTFDFIQITIPHNLKDPHPKALEPDCLSPFLAIATQSRGFMKESGRPKKKSKGIISWPKQNNQEKYYWTRDLNSSLMQDSLPS